MGYHSVSVTNTLVYLTKIRAHTVTHQNTGPGVRQVVLPDRVETRGFWTLRHPFVRAELLFVPKISLFGEGVERRTDRTTESDSIDQLDIFLQ